MQALAEQGWKVDVIGQPAVALLKHCDFVRDATTLSEICPKWPRDWNKLAVWLRERAYTAIIIPFCRPAQLLWASAASGIERRIAMGTTARARLLAHLSGHKFFPTQFGRHPRPYYEIMVDCASPLISEPVIYPPKITLTSYEKSNGRTLLTSHGDGSKWIAIHPTCYGNTCNLPLSTYRELVELILSRTSWSVVITGTEKERTLFADWQPLTMAHPRRIWLAAGQLGLRDLASVLSAVNILVATGTGPMHLAQAVGTQTLSPFCPQVPICPRIWGYSPYERTAILPSSPPCDPDRPHYRNCDFRGTLTSGDFLARLRSILAE
jgi:ADP-heptose:LPS heptosyltransferase